jgi:hypothetical protein
MMERVVCWALAITLSVLLLFIAFQQLFGPTPSPVFGMVEVKSGIDFFEPWGRYLTAAGEILAVVLLLWPRTRDYGAILALVIAVVAIGFHLSPWLGIVIPQPDAFAAAYNANRPLLEDAALLPNDKGGMFILAIVIALLAAANVWFDHALAKLKGRKTKRPAGAYA